MDQRLLQHKIWNVGNHMKGDPFGEAVILYLTRLLVMQEYQLRVSIKHNDSTKLTQQQKNEDGILYCQE